MKKVLIAAFSLALVVAMASCSSESTESNAAENVEAVEEKAEEVMETTEEAVEDAAEAVEDAAEKVEDAAEAK